MSPITPAKGQNRRQILKYGVSAAALAATGGWAGAGRAQSGGPIRIGFLSDMSGMVADLSGAGSVVAAERWRTAAARCWAAPSRS